MADPDLDLDPLEGGSGTESLLNANPWGDFPKAPASPPPPTMPRLPENLQGRPESISPNAVTTEDKAAIAGIKPGTANLPRAQAKQRDPTGLNDALKYRPNGLPPHPVSQARHHTDFGKPPPDTVQPPHPAEIPNVYHGFGQWFAQTNLGSALNQMMGRQMMENTDAFIKNKHESQIAEQKIQYNKMVNSGMATQQRVEGMLMDASEAMGGDPRMLTKRLVAVARKWQSPDLEFKVTHGKAEDAVKWLEELDRRYQDLHATNRQLQTIEDETNANQDILHPSKDPSEKPTDKTPPDDGTGGNPFAHQPIIVPEAVPPTDAAPAPQPAPQPAAPAPPPAGPPVAPAAPAAPDSGQGGFVPNINATDPGAQGALPPEEGVQVAGGGIEDVPRNWYEKMPQVAQADAPPPDDGWQPPESHVMDNAVLGNGQPIPRAAFRQIDDEAANAVMDPRTIQQLGKDKNKKVHAGLVERRANEIRDALGSIASNPHRGLPDRADPRVLSDITKISPSLARLAAIVKAVGDGSIPPPPRNQMYGTRAGLGQIIFPLVGKYDSTMLRPGVYEARAAGLKAFGPGGKAGQNALSVVTGAKHGGLYGQDLDKWDRLGGFKQFAAGTVASIPGEGNLGLNRALRMAGQARMSPELQQLEGSMDFNLHVVVRELERGYTGAQPHEAGIKDIIEKLDWKNNEPQVVRGALARAFELLRERLQESMIQFDGTVGKDPASYMSKYIRSYVSKGQGVLPEGGQVNLEDMGLLDQMIQQIKNPSAAPRGEAPTGPQPGAVEDGWRFKGGDPGDQNNWERVQ